VGAVGTGSGPDISPDSANAEEEVEEEDVIDDSPTVCSYSSVIHLEVSPNFTAPPNTLQAAFGPCHWSPVYYRFSKGLDFAWQKGYHAGSGA
jgi:hypothetical protein